MDRWRNEARSPELMAEKLATKISTERLARGDFTVTDLELLPTENWQQEPWRNALVKAWLSLVQYRNREGEDDLNLLLLETADFMRKHEVLIPPAAMGRVWARNILGIDHEQGVWSVIEKLKTHDPVEDPEAAVGFFLVAGIAYGHALEIETLLAKDGLQEKLAQIPTEYTTRYLVNLLNIGSAHEVLELIRLVPKSLDDLHNHPLFPQCLEKFGVSVIAAGDDVVMEKILQQFEALFEKLDIKKIAAEAVWRIMADAAPENIEKVITRFGLDKNMIAHANNRRWMTALIFSYKLYDPIAAKEELDKCAVNPEMREMLEESLAHHIARRHMSEYWAASLEEQPDSWIEKIMKNVRHKELCWALRTGRIDKIEHLWAERQQGQSEQAEYRKAAILGFREICARGRIAEALKIIDLFAMTAAEVMPIVTKTLKELLEATYFEDAKRLVDQFAVPDDVWRKLLDDTKEQLLHDGDVQLITEMTQVFNLPLDNTNARDEKTNSERDVKEVIEKIEPNILHETIRFYVNESLLAAGKKLREKFTDRGLSVPFRTAITFEPIIQTVENEIKEWQKYVRELLLNNVAIEMIRNQHQVEDPEHTVIEDYENGSDEDYITWRVRANDTDVKRALRQSSFRYGLTGWWPDRGGKHWQRVAEINLGLFLPPSPNTRMVDEAYDLIHHHGTFLIEPTDIAAVVLDAKRQAVNAADLLERSRFYIDRRLFLQLKNRLSAMAAAELAIDRVLTSY